MAHIRREVLIEAAPAAVWDAVRDVGALHTRLVPGLVTATSMEGGARLVTFANGRTVRELIVEIDDDNRRLVWAIVGPGVAHHQGTLQVFHADRGMCHAVWCTDILPAQLADMARPNMDAGMAIMKRTLEQRTQEQ